MCDHINTASSKPIQVECGWGFSSALNKCGDVFVWFPFDQRIEQAILANEIANRTNTVHATRNKEIPCAVWDLQQDSFKLSALPSLPMPPDFKDDIKLVKIAGFDNNLIGLTNYGHVLKYDSVINESAVKRGQWTYVNLNSSSFLVSFTLMLSSQNSCRISARRRESSSTKYFRPWETKVPRFLTPCKSPM